MAVDAWYLVRDTGSATGNGGRVTVKPTGTFDSRANSAVYRDIESALLATTPPTKDSLGLVSDAHDFTASTNMSYGKVVGPYAPLFVSVSDANMDQSSVGARERTGATGDLLLSTANTGIRTHGISFTVGDDLQLSQPNTFFTVEEGAIDFQGSGSRVVMTPDGCSVDLINTDMTFQTAISSGVAQVQAGSMFKMTGGAISNAGNDIDSLFIDGGSAGGMSASVVGVDLSSISDFLVENLGGVSGDDVINIVIDGCKLSSTVVDIDEQFTRPYQSLEVTNSTFGASAAEYGDRVYNWVGSVLDQDSSGIVRIDDVTFESGENTSLQITTTADCSISHPMVIPLSGRYSKLSTAGEDTLTVELSVINTVTLTNTNCFLRVQNPNGTTANLWDLDDTRNADILATGTTLDAGTGVWEDNGVDLTGYNEYSISITISGGGDGYPILELVVMEPSLAGTLYVSKDIQVS